MGEGDSRFGRFLTSYWKNLISTYIFAGVGVIIIVSSFVFVTLQGMWAPTVDVLFPTKVSIVVGMGDWLVATGYGLYKGVTKDGWVVAFSSILSGVLAIGTVAVNYAPLAVFFSTSSTTYAASNALPLEVKILASAALFIPLIFIAVSLVLFFLAVMVKFLFGMVSRWLSTLGKKPEG